MGPDVQTACRFYVEIGGKKQAVFTEVSGLQLEMQTTEYQEGGQNSFMHRLPGPVKVGNITLKRGLVASSDLMEWVIEVITRQISKQHVSVLMFDSRGHEVVRWNFHNAYPVKWVGPQFTADGRTAAIETLELTHDGIELG